MNEVKMKRSVKLSIVTLVLILALAIGLTTVASAEYTADDKLIVSPNVLNLESNGGVVTLHADIGYSSAYVLELEVNGDPLPIALSFPDSLGDLVIRCSMATVKGMVDVGEATFDLTIDGTYFGSDTITVIAQTSSK